MTGEISLRIVSGELTDFGGGKQNRKLMSEPEHRIPSTLFFTVIST